MDFKIFLFVLLFSATFAFQNIRITGLKVEFDKLNREKHNLLEDNAELQLRVSHLAAEKRIEILAQTRLMLKYVERSDLVPIVILPQYRGTYESVKKE